MLATVTRDKYQYLLKCSVEPARVSPLHAVCARSLPSKSDCMVFGRIPSLVEYREWGSEQLAATDGAPGEMVETAVLEANEGGTAAASLQS